MNQALTALLAAFVGLCIGALIRPSEKPKPEPVSHLFTYQAQLSNGLSKVGNIIIESKAVDVTVLNQILAIAGSTSNSVPGGVVLLNATPVYK